MKKSTYIIYILLLMGTLMQSCRKGADFHDAIYFTGTEQSPSTKFTIEGPSSMGLSVTYSAKAGADIAVNVDVVPALVESYNKKHDTKYQFLPANSYDLPTRQLLIKAGTNISDAIQFAVTSLDNFEEGVTYCVPITITGVDKDIDVLEASRTLYIIISRTIITQATVLSPNYFTVPSFLTATSLASVPRLTMECRVLVNAFQTANPYISSVMGIEENFLLRFGDVSIANNQFQLAGGLVNGKKFPVNSKAYFSTAQWYHVAVVYNGSTMSLYINGVLDNYTDAESGGVNLTDSYSGGFHVGYSAGGRLLNGYVSEARVWTRALTAKELQNNLCYVDPGSDGLLAYWRFNELDTDGTVQDLTGHGHKAVAARAVSFVTGVRCP